MCQTCTMQLTCFYPSIREKLGMAAVEVMSCERPLICLINKGTNEFMSNGTIGCYYYSADNEFAEAISKLQKSRQNELRWC